MQNSGTKDKDEELTFTDRRHNVFTGNGHDCWTMGDERHNIKQGCHSCNKSICIQPSILEIANMALESHQTNIVFSANNDLDTIYLYIIFTLIFCKMSDSDMKIIKLCVLKLITDF